MTEFEDLVRTADPQANWRTVPALRGAVLAFGTDEAMTRTAELEEIPDGAWALRGERGLTYADDLPAGNELTEGEWWGPFYDGEPLVSLDEDFAEAAGLEIGDRMTFGVLGVERTVRVANFRRIDWESLGFNYVFVFSPNALRDAPHNLAATIELSPGTPTGPLLQALVAALPSTSVIEVGGVLEQARTILEQVGIATLAAASVAVLAGLAVLLGAIAAAARLPTGGAARPRGRPAPDPDHATDRYVALAGALAFVALGIGSLAAWWSSRNCSNSTGCPTGARFSPCSVLASAWCWPRAGRFAPLLRQALRALTASFKRPYIAEQCCAPSLCMKRATLFDNRASQSRTPRLHSLADRPIMSARRCRCRAEHLPARSYIRRVPNAAIRQRKGGQGPSPFRYVAADQKRKRAATP